MSMIFVSNDEIKKSIFNGLPDRERMRIRDEELEDYYKKVEMIDMLQIKKKAKKTNK